MTLHTFHLPPPAWEALPGPVILDEAETRHLAKVLRIRPGAEVRLFDGQGRHGMFRVEDCGKRARLSCLSQGFDKPPETRCTLAAGFSKALRRGWFMEKTVELEAAAVWFWQGDHSQVGLPEAEKSTWRAALVAGAKQCESAWLPELAMIRGGVEGLVARRAEFERAFLLYEGDTGGRLLQKSDLAEPGSVLLVVGPEGGFSAREAAALSASDVVPVSLGRRILRWETAAVLTLGLAWWARQKP